MQQFSWNMKGFAKGIDPEIAAAEFQRIQTEYGELTATSILEASRPDDAVFHPYFEWNDSKAAHEHRLQQARNLVNNIEVKIVSNGQPRMVPAFELVKSPAGKSYKFIIELNTDDINQIRQRTLKELIALREKIKLYDAFAGVMDSLDITIGALNKVAV